MTCGYDLLPTVDIEQSCACNQIFISSSYIFQTETLTSSRIYFTRIGEEKENICVSVSTMSPVKLDTFLKKRLTLILQV